MFHLSHSVFARPAPAMTAHDDDRRFLTRVVLRNYKSIAAADVYPSQVSFLVGPNGAGKSNVLDALRFVAESLRIDDGSCDPRARRNQRSPATIQRTSQSLRNSPRVSFRESVGSLFFYSSGQDRRSLRDQERRMHYLDDQDHQQYSEKLLPGARRQSSTEYSSISSSRPSSPFVFGCSIWNRTLWTTVRRIS